MRQPRRKFKGGTFASKEPGGEKEEFRRRELFSKQPVGDRDEEMRG
jgi:hypothetical protein